MTPADLAALLRALTQTVLTERGLDVAVLPETVTVERPRNPEHGDYATNIALQIGKRAGVAPRDLAQWLAEAFAAHEGVESADIAGPGFVNLRLAAAAQNSVVATILDAGERYGSGDELGDAVVNLEFVSANPTGPIHLGGTRWAAVGDALGRVLAARGAAVTREYYFNDHGAQIDRFARSLMAAAHKEPRAIFRECGGIGLAIGLIGGGIVDRDMGDPIGFGHGGFSGKGRVWTRSCRECPDRQALTGGLCRAGLGRDQ